MDLIIPIRRKEPFVTGDVDLTRRVIGAAGRKSLFMNLYSCS